jgi:hypothetical protein
MVPNENQLLLRETAGLYDLSMTVVSFGLHHYTLLLTVRRVQLRVPAGDDEAHCHHYRGILDPIQSPCLLYWYVHSCSGLTRNCRETIKSWVDSIRLAGVYHGVANSIDFRVA